MKIPSTQFFLPLASDIFEGLGLKDPAIQILKLGRVPKHVGFIMDGNRTYAKQRGLPSSEGHKSGAVALVNAVDTCFSLGIKEVSVYAFSIENFNRPKKEVNDIHMLLGDTLNKMSNGKGIAKHDVRFVITGKRSLIRPDILASLERIEKSTNANTNHTINICFAYTARDEITHAIGEVASLRQTEVITKDQICECMIAENLYVSSKGEPLELLIRTSGQTRLSDFLLWQSNSDCQIVYIDTLWPSFEFLHLYWILIKWSFEKSSAHDIQPFWGFPKKSKAISLLQLPPCPPFVSVTESKKPRA